MQFMTEFNRLFQINLINNVKKTISINFQGNLRIN